jgi:hypothetical protein
MILPPGGSQMSSRKWLLIWSVLTVVVALSDRPRAQGPTAAFYGIGDLPGGGVGSVVWDATRVDAALYAVGASTLNATTPDPPNLDRPILWSRDTTGNVTLQALPNVRDVLNNPSVHTTPVAAYGMTPDGRYIASQGRAASFSSGTHWLRVDRLFVSDPVAQLNLFSASGASAFASLAISNDGAAVYGQQVIGTGGFPSEKRVPVRYQQGLGLNYPDLAPTGKGWGFTIPRGASSDGLVMVGIASDGAVQLISLPDGTRTTNAVAFRYVHNPATLTGTTTTIPLLPDGTWNMPVAISEDGTQTVVIGNTPEFPNGAVYVTGAANQVTATMGSPTTKLVPRTPGGITADGVVGVTFSGAAGFGSSQQISGLGVPAGNKYGYVHNSHGWFVFSAVLASKGIDLAAMGWDPGNLAITGIRTIDGVDLVFGQGRRISIGTLSNGTVGFVDGAVEGFVAELPAGELAAFNPQPTPPSDKSLVGTWLSPNAANPTGALSYLDDGTYVRITPTGFERGLYTWAGNANGGALTHTTLVDTDGGFGFSSRNGLSGLSAIVIGDGLQFADCAACTPSAPSARLNGTPGSLAGGWIGGPPEAPHSVMFAFTDDNLFMVFDFPSSHESMSGTYTWNPATHELTATIGGEQASGNSITLTPDGLSMLFVDESGESFTLGRIIASDAIAPVIANTPLRASGIVGQPFSYDVDASNAVAFTATNLPDGLSIDAGTGMVTGTPSVGGQFAVAVTATNAVGVSDVETLTLTIAIPTPVGQNVVVEPQVPEGQGPVTLSFGEITGAGTTTVTVLERSDVPPPGSAEIGGVVYEVKTTATYQGLITLCFSYAGVHFGNATPRLFHFENNVWVDITTSVDEASQTICGATTTLSPFAVVVSNVVRRGFYAPVNPIAGYLNTVKGSATVPLKFNVFVNGVAQTTTAGLEMSVQRIDCDTSAPQDEVEQAAVTGGTSLHFDTAAGYFIQNWKTPKTPGCYMVRMTTTQDGLALTARFKVR